MSTTKICTKCKKELPLDAFYKRGPNGRQPKCKECAKAYTAEHRQQKIAYDKAYRETNKDDLYAQKKASREAKGDYLNKVKSVPCAHCGQTFPPVCMALHHVDPSTKLFSPSQGRDRDWTALKMEASKCIVLCHNCHALHHYNEDK